VPTLKKHQAASSCSLQGLQWRRQHGIRVCKTWASACGEENRFDDPVIKGVPPHLCSYTFGGLTKFTPIASTTAARTVNAPTNTVRKTNIKNAKKVSTWN